MAKFRVNDCYPLTVKKCFLFTDGQRTTDNGPRITDNGERCIMNNEVKYEIQF